MLNGDRLGTFLKEMGLDQRPIYRRILHALQEELKSSEQLGSLLPLEKRIRLLVEEERKKYEKEGKTPDLFGWHKEQFETEAGQQEFWQTLEVQIGQALDAFAREQAESGVDQSFFADEAVKGLRLLELSGQTYDVVVANPPYLTARNMNAVLKDGVAKHYPEGKADLYAAFIQRCTEWLSVGGLVGMVTQQSFMFISSYEKLRNWLHQRTVVATMGHVGPRAFDEVTGEKVNTTLLVLRRGQDADAVGTYFRLVKEPDADAKRARFEQALSRLRAGASDPVVYRYRQTDFDAIPGRPWVYWITPGLRNLFETLPKLGDEAAPKCGMTTSDNSRFLRYWWEVGTYRIALACKNTNAAVTSGQRWFPYMKGGSFRRWYGNQEYVVNWEKDGTEIKNCPSFPRAEKYFFPPRRDVDRSHQRAIQCPALPRRVYLRCQGIIRIP